MRRTIMRYVCLCLTVVLSNISPRVKKRFPTLEHFVDAGMYKSILKLIIWYITVSLNFLTAILKLFVKYVVYTEVLFFFTFEKRQHNGRSMWRINRLNMWQIKRLLKIDKLAILMKYQIVNLPFIAIILMGTRLCGMKCTQIMVHNIS